MVIQRFGCVWWGRMKSTAELEEEMLANIPKFKARPLPKKVFLPTHRPSLSCLWYQLGCHFLFLNFVWTAADLGNSCPAHIHKVHTTNARVSGNSKVQAKCCISFCPTNQQGIYLNSRPVHEKFSDHLIFQWFPAGVPLTYYGAGSTACRYCRDHFLQIPACLGAYLLSCECF